MVFLAVEAIAYVVAYDFLGSVVDGFAAMLGCRDGIAVLHVFLHRVAGISPGGGASNCGYRITGPPAYLVTDQTTKDSADHRSGNTVLILHRSSLLHLQVLALFTGNLYCFLDVLDCKHIGVARLRYRLVADDTACTDGYD